MNIFEKGIPEEVGIASSDIIGMLDELESEGLYMHSVLIIKGGKLVAEGYYAPFTRETKHRMYSVSKSFVSGAIGLLYDEGEIKLSDKVHTFFPEFPAETLHPFIRETTIRDLLMMASTNSSTYSISPAHKYSKKWIESCFRTPPAKPAGTVFTYDTGATNLMNVIVERITGKPFLEYMKDKMLRKLGFSEDAWCVQTPEGDSWGGSGIFCTPLDLAKYAYVFLRGGNIDDEQLISAEYVKAATSVQITNDNFGYGGGYQTKGYGYQIWCTPEKGFTFWGMGSQYAYCVPDKDLLIVCTADTQGKADGDRIVPDIFRKYIVQKVSDTPLAENPEAFTALTKRLQTLSLHKPEGMAHSPMEEKIHDVTYEMEENILGFKTIRFTFDGDTGILHYENARGKKEIPFGLSAYKNIRFPETHYYGKQVGVPKGEGYNCESIAVWKSENRLMLRVNVIDDCFGNVGMTFGFFGDTVGLTAAKAAEGFLDDYYGLAGGHRRVQS